MSKLTVVRKKKGLRMVDVATLADCSLSMVWLAENGYEKRLSPRLKGKIAKALRVPVEKLFPDPKRKSKKEKKS